MKRYNITTVRTYEKDGQEKKTYPQVGKLVYFEAKGDKEESFILELNMFPFTRFCVFKDEPRSETQTRQNKSAEKKLDEAYPDDTIDFGSGEGQDLKAEELPI